MLKITYTIAGDQKRIALILQLLQRAGDPRLVPLELPELRGRWIATRYGYRPAEAWREQHPASLTIELEEAPT